jgi:putative addiction module component (TIGR02574 family)
MATSIEQITKEIIELPRHQRLTLVRLLLDLDQPGKGGEIESAWDEEIRARVKAVDEGRVTGIPYDQIKKEVTNRFIPR